MRQALASLALAAVFIAGCSAVAPTADGLDGATAPDAIATGADDRTPVGVPFVGGQPVVASVDVAPPAGHEYGFETTGADIDKAWLAYGVTTSHVDTAMTAVRLALETMIDRATLDTIDRHLAVDAPGGYAVPVADYAVTYAILPDDGTIGATSTAATRAVATASPTDQAFTVTATITGWRDVAGVATMSDVTATFEAPYSIVTSLGFDITEPVVTIDAVTEPAYAGSAYAVSGTASDDVALDRVHLYEGPVLVGSTDSLKSDVDGVAPIARVSDSWTVDWIPAEARSHTLTALAIDAAGNEQRASTTIEVGEPVTTLTFVDGAWGTPATLVAGGRPVRPPVRVRRGVRVLLPDGRVAATPIPGRARPAPRPAWPVGGVRARREDTAVRPEASWCDRPMSDDRRPSDFLPLFAHLPVQTVPGTTWAYDNADYGPLPDLDAIARTEAGAAGEVGSGRMTPSRTVPHRRVTGTPRSAHR